MQLSHNGQMLLTVLEIFLCCGTIFGWPNLLKILKEEEFYIAKSGNISIAVTGAPEEPKEDEKSPQQIQDEAFTAIFTLGRIQYETSKVIGFFSHNAFCRRCFCRWNSHGQRRFSQNPTCWSRFIHRWYNPRDDCDSR
jgi:hypothetical protein